MRKDDIAARKMRPDDGAAVTRLWQRHLPDGAAVAAWLPDIVNELLGAGTVRGGVVTPASDQSHCLAFGLSCFVPRPIADDFVANPIPFLNLRLLKRYRDGDKSVFLDRAAQIPGNTGDGLDLVVLDYLQDTFDFSDPMAAECLNAIVPIYMAAHSGFNIRRALHETELAFGHIQESGGNPLAFEVAPQHPFSFSSDGFGPRGVYMVSRNMVDQLAPTGIAKSILYAPRPTFRLTLREQEVIEYALEGLKDVEIATALGISRDAIRQTWTRIYDHIQEVAPSFFGPMGARKEGDKRGGEKRRLVLVHMTHNPQDLRPMTIRR